MLGVGLDGRDDSVRVFVDPRSDHFADFSCSEEGQTAFGKIRNCCETFENAQQKMSG